MIQSLINGNTTLAVLVGAEPRADSEILATLPMVWIGGRRWAQRDTQPVPLAVFEPPCWFRSAAITALDEAGIPWRVAFTSPSLSGIGAAIDAGLRIIVRTEASVPEKLVALDESAGLPKLPSAHLCPNSAGRMLSPAAARLSEILLQTLPLHLRHSRGQPPESGKDPSRSS